MPKDSHDAFDFPRHAGFFLWLMQNPRIKGTMKFSCMLSSLIFSAV